MRVGGQPPCSYNGGTTNQAHPLRCVSIDEKTPEPIASGSEDASMAEEIIIVQGNNTLAGDVAVALSLIHI